jgi:hypothetical protein
MNLLLYFCHRSGAMSQCQSCIVLAWYMDCNTCATYHRMCLVVSVILCSLELNYTVFLIKNIERTEIMRISHPVYAGTKIPEFSCKFFTMSCIPLLQHNFYASLIEDQSMKTIQSNLHKRKASAELYQFST